MTLEILGQVQAWVDLGIGISSVPLLIWLVAYARYNRRILGNHLMHRTAAIEAKIDRLPCRSNCNAKE